MSIIPIDTPAISFNREKLKKLKQQYEIAKQKNSELFLFENHEILTTYAKYLIQYLEKELGDVQ